MTKQEQPRFIDNNDGTITDNLTGLMWQKETAPGKYSWRDAIQYCENLELTGYNDWRLPSIQELQSIVDYKKCHPAIDPVFNVISSWHWSSSPYVNDTDYAWYVYFYNGVVNYSHYKTYEHYVRAVRGRP